MSYYYKYIFLPKEKVDEEFEERLARQLEYERQHPYKVASGSRCEQKFRIDESMPF